MMMPEVTHNSMQRTSARTCSLLLTAPNHLANSLPKDARRTHLPRTYISLFALGTVLGSHTYLLAITQLKQWVDLAVRSPLHSGVQDCYESPSGASAGQFLLVCLFMSAFSLILEPSGARLRKRCDFFEQACLGYDMAIEVLENNRRTRHKDKERKGTLSTDLL